METLSFQAPTEMKDKLEQFAQTLDRSKAYIIRQALDEYFEDLEDYLKVKAYKAEYDPGDNISLAELKKQLKLD